MSKLTETEMIARLCASLCEKRFLHTMGVAKTAKELAHYYGYDTDKAYTAGLLHDCAKDIPYADAIEDCKNSGATLKDICIKEPGLIHPYHGVVLAERIYGITDKEILSAIKHHTTGHGNMPLLTKIIYLSDSIEPSRNHAGVDTIRELAYKDLDEALLRTMDATIRHIINKGGLLDKNTVEARNFLIIEKKSQI